MKNYMILGNKITAITIEQLNEEIKSIILNNGKELILHANIHGINLAERNIWLKKFRNEAKIVHCDGAGIILGLRILGIKIPSKIRITVHYWMWSLAYFCVLNNFSMYFLGGRPGITEQAAKNLRGSFSNLSIVGTHHGYFDKIGAESQDLVSAINKVKPDILIVGFGMPIQEKWIKDNWKNIDTHVLVAGGGCFDFLSGIKPTCPEWLAGYGLEWLFRLIVEPRRLFTRYIFGNPLFLVRVILERLTGNYLIRKF